MKDTLEERPTAEEYKFQQMLVKFLPDELHKIKEAETPSISIIATKGTLDWAYPPFILASTAAALDWDSSIFFTFYGLLLLKKKLSLDVSPLGNPAMPMKMPFGPKWFQDFDWLMPNFLMANMPGFEKVATSLMKKTFANNGVATVDELRELCLEAEVTMYACEMTVGVFGFSHDDFIDGVKYVGGASFLTMAQHSNICLYI